MTFGDMLFVGGCAAGVCAHIFAASNRIVRTLRSVCGGVDLIASHTGSIRSQTVASSRVAEVQLERMDRAKGGIIPVSAPDESAALDTKCPKCSGAGYRVVGNTSCKLCFGSCVTSAEAAKAYEEAKGLAGSF